MDFELRSKSWLNKAGVLKAVESAVIAPLAKCALAVEGEAKRALSKGTKTRATSGDRRKFNYTSSPPGSPPHIRTGNLRNSIRTAQTNTGTFVVGPTTTAWYGRVQEYGAMIRVTAKMRGFLFATYGWRVGKDAIYIPARPFMRPSLRATIEKYPRFFKDMQISEPSGGKES